MTKDYDPNNLNLQPYDHGKLAELIGHGFAWVFWSRFYGKSKISGSSSNGDQAHRSEQGCAESGRPTGAVIGSPRS